MLPHLYAHGMRLAACWRCHAVLSTYLSLVALLTREQQPRLTKAIFEPVILAGSAFSPCLSACLAELCAVCPVGLVYPRLCDVQKCVFARVKAPKIFPPPAGASGELH